MNVPKRVANIGGGVAGLIAVVLIAVAVNVILDNLRLRADLTEEKLYTLSEGTRSILEDLDRPVILKFFFNESNPQVPVQIKNFSRRVLDLLAEYEVRSDGMIEVQTFDPEPDSTAEDWARRHGLSGQSLGFMGPTLYLGLVAVQGDREQAIPFLDMQAEELLEYHVTRLITRVANPDKPVVAVLSSLPVLGSGQPFAMPGQPPPPQAEPWFAFQDLQQDYDVRELQGDVNDIGEDVDALVVVHPQNLSPNTQFAIDQFVLRGGRLIAFVDPLSVTELQSRQTPPQSPQAGSSNLDPLLSAWGVTYDPGQVVADLEAMSRVTMGRGNEVQENPVWLSLRSRRLNDEDVLTSGLEAVMMPYAGSFDVAPGADVKVDTLIATSESSGQVDAMTARFSVEGIRRSFKAGLEELPLAVRLHGTLPTAFPDGPPAEEDAADDGEEEAGETGGEPEWLRESVTPSTVILVADVDMLYDQFCVRAINLMGYRAHQPMNDNLAFFLNTVEQLAGSTDLVSVRTRGKTRRPFEVVNELERQAQEKYLAEEQRLQERLRDVEQRLSELQRQKDENQRFFLSPEQQAEIDRFQEQAAETREQLKQVRRQLRADIERLGMKIKIINILLMPALVAVGGIAFGLYRRKRQVS